MDWTRVDLDKMLALADGALIALMNDVTVAMKPIMGEPSELAAQSIARYNAKALTKEQLTGPEKWVITRWCLRSKDIETAYRLNKLKES